MTICREIKEILIKNADAEYKRFHSKLINEISPDRIIGVRTPVVRRLAAEFAKRDDIGNFLNDLPHQYYDENNLHAFIIDKTADFDECAELYDRFLPYVDNWATCDMASPKVFAKHPERLLPHIQRWLGSGETFTIRFAIDMLMKHFLGGLFREEYLDWVAGVKSEEYYVKMVQAWFFAEALAKQYDSAVGYIEKCRLSTWVHNKAIQKATESRRITGGQKAYLRSLKIFAAHNK